MNVVARINEFPLKIGGDQHQGWLPAGAAIPLPTPIREVLMNFEIQSDGEDALLCGWSTDGSVGFDTWHRSCEEAEAVAEEEYSVPRHLWEKM